MHIHSIISRQLPHRKMPQLSTLAIWALLATCPSVAFSKITRINPLQAEINQIESELEPLPKLLLTPSPWTLGYRSGFMPQADRTSTIDIHFNTPAQIDMIALLPATYAPRSGQAAAFGFPKRFTIERLRDDGSSEIIVDYSQQDYVATGIEPQLFRLAGPVLANGIRITVLRQGDNPTWWRTKFVTSFSEIMAFSGEWNAALGATVKTSSERPFGYVWTRHCLVDGFSLFSPVDGNLQNPFNNFNGQGEELTLEFDLGDHHHIDELRLWPVMHSLQHKFPQSSGIDFPMQIRFERLATPNAPEGQLIYTSGKNLLKPGSSPLMLRLPSTSGRYFRITLSEPVPDFRAKERPRYALSEIEIIKQGHVLSKGLRPIIKGKKKAKVKSLTDGRTSAGEILPLRTWIEGLNRRASLERRLATLQQNLEFAQRQERERLSAIILVTVGIIPILIWLVKLLADRRWKRTRDRIACDLHDEIGANVSSLAHTLELIEESIQKPSAVQTEMLDEAIHTARLTCEETDNFIQLLEADQSGFDLKEHIQKVARQLMTGLDLTCQIDPELSLKELRVSRQWDLLLFVKEALNNIIKHADATRVEINLCRLAGRIHLDISDNGKGIPADRKEPRHLKLRASRLKSTLKIESLAEKGTRIQLDLK